MKRTRNVDFLTRGLEIVVATQLLHSAYRLTIVTTCAKLFQNIFSGLKVMDPTRTVDFKYLTLKGDLDLGGNNPIIALYISFHNGDHLCQVI
jgi:hypothetical protein